MQGLSGVDTPFPGLPSSYVPRQYCAVWKEAPPGWREKLRQALDGFAAGSLPPIFFRADDIGAGGRAFEALCALFRHHAVPLAMAVVPAWLSSARQEQLFRTAPPDEPIWGWHQHGWRHVNWQKTGKKSEFGDSRPFEKQFRDILQGRQKMEELFGRYFLPVFTPPWNRLSNSTLKILQSLRFEGVSMAGPLPRGIKPQLTLCNLKVQLDLHTRKRRDANIEFSSILQEIGSISGKKEPFGIMIHHHRMTLFAFEFLDELLYSLTNRVRARFLSFGEIVNSWNDEQTGSSVC